MTTLRTHAIAEPTAVYTADLLSAFSVHAPHIKILSLDCFDTLLWRTTATPVDVFYNLAHRPTFNALGYTASLRANSEIEARKLNMIRNESDEAILPEIYRAAFPDINEEVINALCAEELAEEMESCYAYPPVVELIREAHAQGIKIIITSDTYLREPELRQLLTACLPRDVMQAISKIYCSSEFGKAKGSGLFDVILQHHSVPAKNILHIGDNINADYHAPRTYQIKSLHLLHQHDTISEILRMQALTGNFLDPNLRWNRSMCSPFRGLYAQTKDIQKPETAIGFAAVGPVLYAFAKMILSEIEKLTAQGKKPKVLFLMRDGHLPALICEAITNTVVGSRVRISRFVALAASFRTTHDIDKYLSDVAGTLRFRDICKQFLLSEKIANTIIAKAESAGNHSGIEFIKQIQTASVQQKIISASNAFRTRLIRHLEQEAQIQPGDTVLFVDLGYTGTAEIRLAPVLRDEMQIEVRGLYLIALRTPGWEKSRKGLLDPSWCDDRAMLMLVSYIALIEQICTSSDASVVDFDNTGNPIFSTASVSKAQHKQMDLLQNECIRFAKEAEQFAKDTRAHWPLTLLRDYALSSLSRLLYIPTELEMQFFQSFEFDLNLGTQDILQVFDRNAGLQGLKRRGLFFMEKNMKSMRTNYPAELRTAGLELSLILMAQHRYATEIRKQDLSLLREPVPVIIIRGSESLQTELLAEATHAGYYSLTIPLGLGQVQIGIQFGKPYHYLQIESADLIPTKALLTQFEAENTEDASAYLLSDQLVDKGQGLYEALSETGLVMLSLPHKDWQMNHVFRVVFRPIVKRE